jgi:adenylate kinase
LYVVLLGLPGAGKGTQASRLRERTGLAHITTGELFRENIRQGTELGKRAQPYVEQGLLVPDEITISMLLERISQPDARRGFVLDGFPRTIEQAEALDRALAGEGKRIGRVPYIRAGTEELVRRLAGRWNCKECGAVYHELSSPSRQAGRCDNCGSTLYQRKDDKPEVVRTRLDVNMRNLQPLLDYYRRQGKLVEVDGERDAEEVTEDLARVIESKQCR